VGQNHPDDCGLRKW